MKQIGWIILVALIAKTASADGFWEQFKDPDDGRFDTSAFLADNAYGFLPLPIIITDPAVDGGLGLVGLFFHETEDVRRHKYGNNEFEITARLRGYNDEYRTIKIEGEEELEIRMVLDER